MIRDIILLQTDVISIRERNFSNKESELSSIFYICHEAPNLQSFAVFSLDPRACFQLSEWIRE